jgi:hypothetical protein
MTFLFNIKFPDAPNEAKWEQIRLWRNEELSRTDWTQLEDSPVDKAAWSAYRAALRDLPAQGGDAEKAKFPTAP